MKTCRDAWQTLEHKVWRFGEVGDPKLEKLWNVGEPTYISQPLQTIFGNIITQDDHKANPYSADQLLRNPSKARPKNLSRCLLSLTSMSKEQDRNTAISATTLKQSLSATSQSSLVKAGRTTMAISISMTGSNRLRTLSGTLTGFFELLVSVVGRM